MNFFPRSWSQSQRSLRKSFPLISNKHLVWPSFIKGETYYPLYVTFAQLLALVLVDSHQGLLARKQDPAKEAVRFEACSTGVFWASEIGACLCSYCGIRRLWFYDRWRLERVGARAKKGKEEGRKKMCSSLSPPPPPLPLTRPISSSFWEFQHGAWICPRKTPALRAMPSEIFATKHALPTVKSALIFFVVDILIYNWLDPLSGSSLSIL